jgi:hypothetical protein
MIARFRLTYLRQVSETGGSRVFVAGLTLLCSILLVATTIRLNA